SLLHILALLSLVIGVFTHCGYVRNTTNPKGGRGRRMIIGGEKVKSASYWPWQVAVQVYGLNGTTEEYEWRKNCGGTVIAERWILTAAHCIKYWNKYRIVGDTLNANTGRASDSTLISDVARAILHEGYQNLLKNKTTKGTLFNDIALLELNDTLAFNDIVEPICLPSREKIIPEYGTTIAVGFGQSNGAEPSTREILVQDGILARANHHS
ncbi:hypothetical protein PFISCL1PPCAC_17815, partial [Pristionchus fissidentatus]